MTGEDPARLLDVIAMALGAFLLGYGLLPLAPALLIAALCVFVAHLGAGGQWTISSYGLQMVVPDHIRGRVFSFDFALTLLAQTVSTVVAGVLAAVVGPVITLYLMIGSVAVAGVLWLVWTRPLRRPLALSRGGRRAGTGGAEDVP